MLYRCLVQQPIIQNNENYFSISLFVQNFTHTNPQKLQQAPAPYPVWSSFSFSDNFWIIIRSTVVQRLRFKCNTEQRQRRFVIDWVTYHFITFWLYTLGSTKWNSLSTKLDHVKVLERRLAVIERKTCKRSKTFSNIIMIISRKFWFLVTTTKKI